MLNMDRNVIIFRLASLTVGVICVTYICLQIHPYAVNTTVTTHELYVHAFEFNDETTDAYVPSLHKRNAEQVYSFTNVCIEPLRNPVNRSIMFFDIKGVIVLNYTQTQRIVIYDNQIPQVGTYSIRVPRKWTVENQWDLTFRNTTLPKSRKLRNTTAFFVSPFCPSNFHHFYDDFYAGLYTVMKDLDRLHPGMDNQILYREPNHLIDKSMIDIYWNWSRYKDILNTLYVAPFQSVFYDLEPYTCFNKAVFGYPVRNIKSPKQIVSYLLDQFKVRSFESAKSDCFVTFIQRSSRRIINLNDVLESVKKAGISKARIVNLEKIPLKQQMEIAVSTCVLVGVNGAGLQWGIFMPPKSTVVEIGWPKQHWPDWYYKGCFTRYDVSYRSFQVPPENVYVNWTSYERNVLYGRKTTEQERKEATVRPKNAFDNVYKHADVILDTQKLVEMLLDITSTSLSKILRL